MWGWGLPGTDEALDMTFALPAGTVTFLLSDIEGSTQLWEAEFDAMAEAVPTTDCWRTPSGAMAVCDR
jgi:class 3 adenylate cyclase